MEKLLPVTALLAGAIADIDDGPFPVDHAPPALEGRGVLAGGTVMYWDGAFAWRFTPWDEPRFVRAHQWIVECWQAGELESVEWRLGRLEQVLDDVTGCL